MEEKVQRLLQRLQEVEEQLGQADVFADQKHYRKLTQDHAYLSTVKESWYQYCRLQKQLEDNELLLVEESDPELLKMVQEEVAQLPNQIAKAKNDLELLLVPPDPRDDRNIIVEVRAGTGGDEAALFVGDCVRMYFNYSASKSWQVETLSFTESDLGGFKEYMFVLSGKNVFRLMQYEAGTHRVQRVPATEAQGRVHTSAITVAILLEPEEDEKIVINEAELRIETYRASGAGGQHVNVTDSAVRITHIPTGTVVACQEERSQHKNRDKAMRLLKAKIADQLRSKQQKELSELRSTQIGSGDRSERIRTYNFPQNRLTDHRIDLSLYKLDRIMDGDLDDVTSALVSHFYQKQLTT
jgi:peptide chain release factor 1